MKQERRPDVYFRAGVGAVLLTPDRNVVVFERRKIPDSWQFPQGGLEADESPKDAVYRELKEETGLRRPDVTLVDRYPGLLAYELPESMRSPKTGLGQVHYWFLFKLPGPVSIDLPAKGEFGAWKSVTIDDAVASAAEFRRHVYEHLRRWIESIA